MSRKKVVYVKVTLDEDELFKEAQRVVTSWDSSDTIADVMLEYRDNFIDNAVLGTVKNMRHVVSCEKVRMHPDVEKLVNEQNTK